MFTRRNLLSGGLAMAGLGALGIPRLARAASGRPTRLVVWFSYGGWDPTYLFDPKPGAADVDSPDGDWATYGDLQLWEAAGMERAADFFTVWSDRTAVVNGIAISSLVHEECARRMLTGTSTEDWPDIGARVASALGGHTPLPYFTMGANARVDGLEAQAGTSGYSNQLSSLVVPEMAWPAPGGGWQPASGLRTSEAEESAVQAYLSTRAEQLKARAGTDGSSGVRMADYLESLDRAGQIRDSAPGNFLSDTQLFYSYDNNERAARALADGFCQAVFITDGGYWDTHFGNASQASLFNDLFGSLSSLMGALEDAGIADETMVLVISEMGRSPLLNANSGKDHWPYTSALLVSPGVRPGVFGATDDTLRQEGIDLDTGAATDGGHTLEAGDVLATVAELMGLDAAGIYPDQEVLRVVVA